MMSSDEAIAAVNRAVAAADPILRPNAWGLIVFTRTGLAMSWTNINDKSAFFHALHAHAAQNIMASYPPGVNTDSHGFVRIVHPKGYSAATIDTNAVTIGELQLVIAVMRETGRGRKA